MLLKQVCIPVGCVLHTYCPYLPACTALRVSAGGVSVPGGSAGGGGLLRQVSAPGGGRVCSQGLSAPGGVSAPRGRLLLGGCMPACTEADTPREQNDRCKNITFANICLWAVNMSFAISLAA